MKAGEHISKRWSFNEKYRTKCHILPSSMFKEGNIHWAYWCGIAQEVSLLLFSMQLKKAHCSEQYKKPVVSTDFRETKTKENLSAQFHQQCECVHHIMNSYLGCIAPNLTAESQVLWNKIRSIPVKQVEKTKDIKCHYFSHAVHFNKATHFHRDKRSCWSGFDAIAPFGCYSGGWLEFHDLGIRIPSRPGDLLFIQGAALWHDAVDWRGDGEGEGRMVFAFFSDR